jgi:hypothetical protein
VKRPANRTATAAFMPNIQSIWYGFVRAANYRAMCTVDYGTVLRVQCEPIFFFTHEP